MTHRIKRLRILHVIHGLPRGGLENGVVNLINWLPRAEFTQAICCLDSLGEMKDRINAPFELFFLQRGRHDLRIPLRIAALIHQWRPQVVHCRNWNTWLDVVLGQKLAALSGCKTKLVWSFHGFPDGQEAMPWRRRIISRWLARNSRHLFAVCKDSALRYARASGIPEERFAVLYNGVDCQRFAEKQDIAAVRHSLGLSNDSRLVITVASLTPVKDHLTLVRAIQQVAKKCTVPVCFLFVGEGAERQAISDEIKACKVTDKIQLTGNRDDVPALLAAADLFVLPSRLEGMSNSIIEAMAAGLPVVCNATGGNPELVDEGKTGLLGSPGDEAQMATAICQLLENEVLRDQMADKAKLRAQERFSMAAMLQNYARYYREVDDQ